MNVAVAATTFVVIFLAELPDKSLFASLVLGARYSPLLVWAGAGAAFVVHVVLAVLAGGLLTLLPHRVVEAVVALLFAVGAVLLLRPEPGGSGAAPVADRAPRSAWSVLATSFGVVFLGEWGDITQIATANLAARYRDPVAVGIGAAAGLLAVSGVAIAAGSTVLRRLPVQLVRRLAGSVLAGLAVLSLVALLR